LSYPSSRRSLPSTGFLRTLCLGQTYARLSPAITTSQRTTGAATPSNHPLRPSIPTFFGVDESPSSAIDEESFFSALSTSSPSFPRAADPLSPVPFHVCVRTVHTHIHAYIGTSAGNSGSSTLSLGPVPFPAAQTIQPNPPPTHHFLPPIPDFLNLNGVSGRRSSD
jgi:hypothetical protein